MTVCQDCFVPWTKVDIYWKNLENSFSEVLQRNINSSSEKSTALKFVSIRGKFVVIRVQEKSICVYLCYLCEVKLLFV